MTNKKNQNFGNTYKCLKTQKMDFKLILEKHKFSEKIVRFHGVVVACSGGLDSICLSQAFYSVHETAGPASQPFNLALAHVNYGLRGEDSNADQKLVEVTAQKFGVELFLRSISQEERTKRSGQGVQDWARQLRYEFFRDIASRGWMIALAHHRDDLAENILFRLARGVSPKNLVGMSVWNPPFFRPFLDLSKSDLQRYQKDNSLAFRHDASNDKMNYSRNRIRQQVLPILEEICPGAGQRIVSLGQQIEDQGSFVDGHIIKRLTPALEDDKLPLTVYFSLMNEFLPEDVLAAFLRHMFRTKLNLSEVFPLNRQMLTKIHAKIVQAELPSKSFRIQLPLGLLFRNEKAHLVCEVQSRRIKLTRVQQSQYALHHEEFDVVIPPRGNLKLQVDRSQQELEIYVGSSHQQAKRVRVISPASTTMINVKGLKHKISLKNLAQRLGLSPNERGRFYVIHVDGLQDLLYKEGMVYEINSRPWSLSKCGQNRVEI